MENLIKLLAPLKIPADIVLGTIFITTLFFTFCSDVLLNKLSLLDFVTQNKTIISILLVITSSYFLISVIDSIRKRFNHCLNFQHCSKNLLRTLNNLSQKQKTILANLYVNNSGVNFNITDPDIIYLAKCQIISVIFDLENYNSAIPQCKCNLNLSVKEFLNRNKKFVEENRTKQV